MAVIFYKSIKKPGSNMTIEDVPAIWRSQVQEMLDAEEV